ncbi:hypothetical protein EYF80_028732 [Liparis tanakae]|uniref:Uncharacterized protein n=1 Tax=Liparis tanakae TaxID=230148 RepID=A0A4Z2H5L0_9TELE|nr:hypothetical protein EYF80_028732 [Liparis tanakae]
MSAAPSSEAAGPTATVSPSLRDERAANSYTQWYQPERNVKSALSGDEEEEGGGRREEEGVSASFCYSAFFNDEKEAKSTFSCSGGRERLNANNVSFARRD